MDVHLKNPDLQAKLDRWRIFPAVID